MTWQKIYFSFFWMPLFINTLIIHFCNNKMVSCPWFVSMVCVGILSCWREKQEHNQSIHNTFLNKVKIKRSLKWERQIYHIVYKESVYKELCLFQIKISKFVNVKIKTSYSLWEDWYIKGFFFREPSCPSFW